MKKRAQKVLITVLLVVMTGLLYAGFFIATGIGIPCIFHKVTGLLCPGCGVSRMCLSLMRGDVKQAAEYNPLLFFLLPILLLILSDCVIRYVKTGELTLRRWQNGCLYVILLLLLLFGILRNIPW